MKIMNMEKMNMVRGSGLAAMICVGLLTMGAAQAVNVKFTGKLVEQPTCTLNEGKDISVDFANVAINKIDGVAYKKMEIPYSVSCNGGSAGYGDLKVKLGFAPVSWGTANRCSQAWVTLACVLHKVQATPLTSAIPN